MWPVDQATYKRKTASTPAGPGGAVGLGGFWAGALQAANLPQAVPHERWALQRHYAEAPAIGKMYVRHAAFLADVAAFDAAAFRRASAVLAGENCAVLSRCLFRADHAVYVCWSLAEGELLRVKKGIVRLQGASS